jgi:hypothetical protein
MADVEHLLRAYFAGEKAEAFWILAAGVAGLVTAIALWSWAREPFARGLAAALLLIAALGLAVGGTVYFRSDAQADSLVQLHQSDAPRFAAEEGARMTKVILSFAQYRIGYALAIALALVLAYVLGKPWQHGFAVGLLLLAALGLTIDFYAEHRAIKYVRDLHVHGWLTEASRG